MALAFSGPRVGPPPPPPPWALAHLAQLQLFPVVAQVQQVLQQRHNPRHAPACGGRSGGLDQAGPRARARGRGWGACMGQGGQQPNCLGARNCPASAQLRPACAGAVAFVRVYGACAFGSGMEPCGTNPLPLAWSHAGLTSCGAFQPRPHPLVRSSPKPGGHSRGATTRPARAVAVTGRRSASRCRRAPMLLSPNSRCPPAPEGPQPVAGSLRRPAPGPRPCVGPPLQRHRHPWRTAQPFAC